MFFSTHPSTKGKKTQRTHHQTFQGEKKTHLNILFLSLYRHTPANFRKRNFSREKANFHQVPNSRNGPADRLLARPDEQMALPQKINFSAHAKIPNPVSAEIIFPTQADDTKLLIICRFSVAA
ncbi:hypothetical protein TNIN_23661 [Trichonephila inaurata madagascariensis]|uniref:Uncharacterized protein n=1 Tax=Trichonephila inaurata madagascariensis TaxID=2747483 RepID=A0A8X7CT28_9ARAC|nr:hypothetical protein TNIN_23661 [Trichonephila inaurata madagascariensis]